MQVRVESRVYQSTCLCVSYWSRSPPRSAIQRRIRRPSGWLATRFTSWRTRILWYTRENGQGVKAIDALQAKSSILEHKNKGLENAILLDKKTKRKKRKPNMQGGDACSAQFWSTEEVPEAQAQLQAKDDEEGPKKVAKTQKKASAEAVRKQKGKDKQEKAVEEALARQAAKEARAMRQISKREAREATITAKALEERQRMLSTASPKASKAVPKSRTNAQASKAVRIEVQEEEAVQTQTRTRVVKPPQHFEYK